MGGKWENRAVDRCTRQTIERREKECDVHRRLIDVAVIWHDEQHDAPGALVSGGGNQQRLRRGAGSRDGWRRSRETASHDRGLQNGAEIK